MRAWDTYAYDEAGQRIGHTTTPDGTAINEKGPGSISITLETEAYRQQ